MPSWFLPLLLLGVGAAAAAPPVQPISDYAIQGRGDTRLLLVPCMSCRWRAFDTFMERNADRYTMYAVTLPGFGGSAAPELPLWPDRPVWHRNAVAALIHFIDRHDLEDVIVVSHSWGSVISAELLAEYPGFARGWVILDTHVPVNPAMEAMSDAERLEEVARWRAESMEPLRAPDDWAAFNRPPSYAAQDRQLLYFGMFMATPPDVMFQYWRENGLRDINRAFSGIRLPVLELKSIPPGTADPDAARVEYLARYRSVPAPEAMRTVFVDGGRHHLLEQRPEVVDDVIHRFVGGRPVNDYPALSP